MSSMQPRSLGIQEYLIILSNRFYIILVCMAASMAVFGMYAIIAPNRFTASNQIEVKVRSEEPLRQPLVKTSSFLRRVGIMKQRLTNKNGTRSLVAATNGFNCNGMNVQCERVLYWMEMLEQNARETKEVAEKKWNTLRAPVNEHKVLSLKQQAKRDYQKAKLNFVQAQAVLSSPHTAMENVLKEIESRKIVSVSKLEELKLLFSEDTDSGMTQLQKEIHVSEEFKEMTSKLQESWDEFSVSFVGYNQIRSYEELKSQVEDQSESKLVTKEVKRRLQEESQTFSGLPLEDLLQMQDMERAESSKFAGARKALGSYLKITTRGTNQISVSFSSDNAQLSADVVNNVVDQFKILNLHIQEEEIKDAVQVLQNEVHDMEVIVSDLRRQIITYGTKYPDIFAENPKQNLAQTSVTTGNENQQLTEWRNTNERLLSLLEDRRASEERLKLMKKQLEITTKEIKAEDIQVLSSERSRLDNYINQLRFERVKLLSDSTPLHPRVQELDNEIHALQNRVDSLPLYVTETIKRRPNAAYLNLEGRIGQMMVELEALQAREEILRERVRSSYNRLKEMPERVVALNELQTKYEIANSRLSQYQNSLKTAETTKRLELDKEGTVFIVSERASPPRSPSSPNRILILLMGLMVGCALTLSLVFVLEYLDHSIKDISDAHRYLRMPVLGVISEFSTMENSLPANRSSNPFSDDKKPKGGSSLDGDRRTFWERFVNKENSAKLFLFVSIGLYAMAAGQGYFYDPDAASYLNVSERNAAVSWVPVVNTTVGVETGPTNLKKDVLVPESKETVDTSGLDIPDIFGDLEVQPVESQSVEKATTSTSETNDETVVTEEPVDNIPHLKLIFESD